jgi:hypothetical protein
VRLIDISGKRYGQLTVVERAENDRHRNSQWRCRCDCGASIVVRGHDLKIRQGKGCRDCLSGLRPFEAIYRLLCRTAQTSRERVIPVTLSYEEFVGFTTDPYCFYCKTLLWWPRFRASGHGYNLDRKDSTQGYSKENCVPCCARCNKGKGDWFTFDEWWIMTTSFRRVI